MRPIPLIIIGGAVLLLITKVAKATNLASLNFVIGGIQPGWEGISPVLDIKVVAQNPTNNDYTMRSLVGDVYLNGKYLGNLSSFAQTVVKAVSANPITIRVKISAAEVVKQAFDIIEGKTDIAANLLITGKVNVDYVLYPIDMQYKIV